MSDEIDLGFLFKLGVNLNSSLEQMNKRLAHIEALEAAYEERGPVRVALRAAEASDASGAAIVLDLGGPAHGRLWEVRRLVLGGAAWSSTAAGTALIVTGSGTASSAPPLPDVVDEAASLPKVSFYSSGQVVLRNPAHLYIVIDSPTASTTYAAGGEAFDMPDRPTRAVFER